MTQDDRRIIILNKFESENKQQVEEITIDNDIEIRDFDENNFLNISQQETTVP